MNITKPAAIGLQILGGFFLIAGLFLMLYVYASTAAMFTAMIGAGLVTLGHPKVKP